MKKNLAAYFFFIRLNNCVFYLLVLLLPYSGMGMIWWIWELGVWLLLAYNVIKKRTTHFEFVYEFHNLKAEWVVFRVLRISLLFVYYIIK